MRRALPMVARAALTLLRVATRPGMTPNTVIDATRAHSVEIKAPRSPAHRFRSNSFMRGALLWTGPGGLGETPTEGVVEACGHLSRACRAGRSRPGAPEAPRCPVSLRSYGGQRWLARIIDTTLLSIIIG